MGFMTDSRGYIEERSKYIKKPLELGPVKFITINDRVKECKNISMGFMTDSIKEQTKYISHLFFKATIGSHWMEN